MSLKVLENMIDDLKDLKEYQANNHFLLSDMYTEVEDEEHRQIVLEDIPKTEQQIKDLEYGIKCMVVGLFVQQEISISQAAELYGLSLNDFCEFLKQKGVALVRYNEEAYEQDMKTLEVLEKKKKGDKNE